MINRNISPENGFACGTAVRIVSNENSFILIESLDNCQKRILLSKMNFMIKFEYKGEYYTIIREQFPLKLGNR
jgi:hypothetical protein